MATSGNQPNYSSLKGSDFLDDIVCRPCLLDDLSKPAFGYCTDCDEHLCSMCYVNHRKSRPSRHHRLLDSSSMPQTQTLDDTDTTVDEDLSDSLTTPCEKHSQKCIEYYCNDHNMTLCSVCVTLNHTKPCKVDYIPDISKLVLKSDNLREIIARAQSIEDKCDTVKNIISRDTQHTLASLKRSLSGLKKYRSDINRILDSKEKEIIDLTQQNIHKVKTTGTKCDVMKTDSKLQKDKLNQINKSKQPNQLFIEIQQTRKILDVYEDSLQSIENQHHIDKYQFIPNTAILEAEDALGTIASQQQVISPFTHFNIPSQRDQYTNIKPTNKDEILVKTSGERYNCWITGMTEIVPDILVLADTNNYSIKLVDVQSKLVTSTLRLEEQPWDITAISSTEVAVTVPGGKNIQFVTVSNNLKKSRRIHTNSQCYGICYHQDKLIVTYHYPGKLELLDMEGNVIRLITAGTTGIDIFSDPYYVQATNNNIYVSDQGQNNIFNLMVDYNGIVVSGCSVKRPYGMTSLNDGSIFICSYTENKIYQLTGDIKKCTAILQDVERPQAICVNHQQNKVYISRTYSNSNIDNTILVWNI